MKYVISNISVLPTKKAKDAFTFQVEKLVKKLKIVPTHYLGSERLKINISKINNYEYRVTCSLKLKNSLVFLTETGKDFISVSTLLFDKFRKKVAIQLEKRRVLYSRNKSMLRSENIENHLEDLQEFKHSKDETSYKSLVKDLLPGLERYVQRMLKSAKMSHMITRGDLTPEDIIDEVIVRTFKTFENNRDQTEDMNIWMMQETDVVLNELIDTSKLLNHAASVEELIDSEFAGLEEKYMFDSSGDPIMMDELDEYDQTESMLGIEEILLVGEGENEMIEQISENLSRKQMKELIQKELLHLPLRHQAIYDLYFLEQNNIEDIAKIKNEKPERVEEIIEEVKQYLTKKLNL